eukprot:CAMPEP_0119138988 /NCGR_PEP_ID=MMETSP1310-20130426/26687_1 /TAXON_ID=464262 /ORGANISM="Genus nov. species nov., Strain RCC2339" /LENGTH=495 /DNA_ID=CAMNT_0007130239 /DNA_START=123 /DNA_END=1607 /DNA_ORIENTATION=-
MGFKKWKKKKRKDKKEEGGGSGLGRDGVPTEKNGKGSRVEKEGSFVVGSKKKTRARALRDSLSLSSSGKVLEISSPMAPSEPVRTFKLQEQLVWNIDDNVLDAFEVKKCLGHGGSGAVYRAVHKATGAELAIKVIAAPIFREFSGELQNEVQMLRTACHPNIITFYGLCVMGRYAWLLQELATGGCIMDYVRRIYPEKLKEKHLATIAKQTCEALGYLHDHGIVHRDVKGENLLLARDTTIKLGDFGLATRIEEAGADMSGTPHFMAPELWQFALARNGGDESAVRLWGPATDVWALGITMLELIFSTPPRLDLAGEELHTTIAEAPAPTVRGEIAARGLKKRNFAYSKDLDQFLAACLERDPARRMDCPELLGSRFMRRAMGVLGDSKLFRRTNRKHTADILATPEKPPPVSTRDSGTDPPLRVGPEDVRWVEQRVKDALGEQSDELSLREETLGYLLSGDDTETERTPGETLPLIPPEPANSTPTGPANKEQQ